MKSPEKLHESYLIQKKQFDEAEQKRISNIQLQITKAEAKIQRLQSFIDKSKGQLVPKEFESEDSFRSRATAQSDKSKRTP